MTILFMTMTFTSMTKIYIHDPQLHDSSGVENKYMAYWSPLVATVALVTTGAELTGPSMNPAFVSPCVNLASDPFPRLSNCFLHCNYFMCKVSADCTLCCQIECCVDLVLPSCVVEQKALQYACDVTVCSLCMSKSAVFSKCWKACSTSCVPACQ